MLPIWVGFWVQNSLNKGPSDFSKTWVCFPEIAHTLKARNFLGIPRKFLGKKSGLSEKS